MHRGWVVSLGAVLSWALLSAISRVILIRFKIDPWGFSFIQLTTGGLVLLLISGRLSLARASFRKPTTWIIGLFRVLSASAYTALLAMLSVLEAGIMGAISLTAVTLAAWVVFARPPGRGEIIGHLIVLGCAGTLLQSLDGGLRDLALILVLANTICVTAMTILAERHPDNHSVDASVRLGFTGAVLLVTAGMFLVVRLAQAGLSPQIWDWQMLVFGALVGVFLRAPSMVLAFASIRLVGSQNYSAATAFLPLFGMALEHVFYVWGWIGISRFQFDTLYLGFGTAAGTIAVLGARFLSRRTERRMTTRENQIPRSG
ncbi:hypothetical protein [Roseovarius sp.]|uniref:EamA family transporter n=1 Tax=Roseovarius sp. TaxID=1486281 RepID=UPI002625282F|nr:hypothetical protein [Roseovarius sp.]